MELSRILEENDFSKVLEYSGTTGNNPSRADFEDMVYEAVGHPTPNNTMRFIAHTANDKWFFVYYVKDADKFLYEKLTAR